MVFFKLHIAPLSPNYYENDNSNNEINDDYSTMTTGTTVLLPLVVQKLLPMCQSCQEKDICKNLMKNTMEL